jgi:hypothetical protein
VLNTLYGLLANLLKGLPPPVLGIGLIGFGIFMIVQGQVLPGAGFIAAGVSDIVHKTNDVPPLPTITPPSV